MLIRGISIYSIGELLFRLGKILIIYLMAAVLTEQDFGVYSYFLSTAAVAVIVLDCGLNQVVLLRCRSANFQYMFPVFANAKMMVVAAGIVLIGLTMSASRLLPGNQWIVVPAFMLFCFALDLQGFIGNALRARLANWADAKLKIAGLVLFLLAVAAAYFLGPALTPLAVIVLQAATTLIAILLMASNLRSLRLRLRGAASRAHVRRASRLVLKLAAPVAVAAFGAQMSSSIDPIVLGASGHFAENASFTLAQRIIFLFQLPMVLILTGAVPFIVQKLAGSARKPAVEYVRLSINGLILLALVTHGLYLAAINDLLPMIFPGKYADVVTYGRVLVYVLIPIFVYPIFYALLCATRRVFSTHMILLAATLANVTLDILAIRHFGPEAVPWVTVTVNWAILICLAVNYMRTTASFPFAWRDSGYVALGVMLIVGINFSERVPGATRSLVWLAASVLIAILLAAYCISRRRLVAGLVLSKI